jgi:hypothetical protein
MLPSGYPGVVRDGVAALNWAAAAMARALERIPEWVAEWALTEQSPANVKARAEMLEKAKREGTIYVVAWHDAASWTRSFTDSRGELAELASRLARRTQVQWQSGDAAQYFSGLELRILEGWASGAHERLIKWLGEKPADIRRRQMEFGQLSKWLRDYLASNA